ncbi:hypothetical protein KGQ71_01625 [Patescibacteria group bacterium]|nr:hypothetical protein [Patescibacteria group bacterium]
MQHLEDGTARAVQFAREQYEQAVQALSNEVTGAQGRTGSQIKYIIEASRQQLETYEQTIREQEKGLDRLSPKQVSPVNPVTPIAARPGSFFSRLFRKQPATMEPAAYAQNQITETRRTIQEIDEEIAQAVKLCHLRETGIFQPGYHVTIKDPAFETGLKLEEMRQLGWGTRTQVGPDNQAPINQSYESWKANGKPRRS